MTEKGITPRGENYSQWYLDIIERAELAENSSVRGCMVKAIWICYMGKNTERVR